jgi:thymidylate synthase (FAD)
LYSAKLIAVTKPTEEFHLETGAHNAEDLVSYCARVSNPSNQDKFDTSEKLLKYCMKKKHWSIFQMVDLVIELHVTRDIGRQILRHRSFSFQEFSQRYAAVNTEDFIVREARIQDPKNRQASIEVPLGSNLNLEWASRQQEVFNLVKSNYEWALDNNIAKEQARCILPEGNTPSIMYMKGSLRDWFFYSWLRMGVETQKEHRIIAQYCWEIIKKEFSFLETIDIKEI